MCIAKAKSTGCVQLLILSRTPFLINKDFSPSDVLKITQDGSFELQVSHKRRVARNHHLIK